jgi:hypothetical protein
MEETKEMMKPIRVILKGGVGKTYASLTMCSLLKDDERIIRISTPRGIEFRTLLMIDRLFTKKVGKHVSSIDLSLRDGDRITLPFDEWDLDQFKKMLETVVDRIEDDSSVKGVIIDDIIDICHIPGWEEILKPVFDLPIHICLITRTKYLIKLKTTSRFEQISRSREVWKALRSYSDLEIEMKNGWNKTKNIPPAGVVIYVSDRMDFPEGAGMYVDFAQIAQYMK